MEDYESLNAKKLARKFEQQWWISSKSSKKTISDTGKILYMYVIREVSFVSQKILPSILEKNDIY